MTHAKHGVSLDAYGRLLSRTLFPTWENWIRRRPTLRRLQLLERSQWMSLDELTALQMRALRRLLRHAYQHVPLYHRRFRDAGLVPEDIRAPGDLAALPILTRDEARETSTERLAKAPPEPSVHKSTSGTLGRPLAFSYNLDSDLWRTAVKLRGYAWAGYRVGVRSLHYWMPGPRRPPPPQRAKIALDRALKRERHLDCARGDREHLERAVQEIQRYRPQVIVTYSQAGAALARHIEETGARDWDTIPVLCGAERLLDADRSALERAFGPAVFETYGCREFMLIATECEAHDGLHEQMENLLVEIVVREGDRTRPAEPGEIGEVVVTDLHNLAMPFIRYANGDLAMARAPGRCACGRELPRIGPIEGRVTETVRDGDGAPVHGLSFNLMFLELARYARQFQVVQHPDRSITLKLVPERGLTRDHLDWVRGHCARYVPGVPMQVSLVDEIPPSPNGKRQVVCVERAQ